MSESPNPWMDTLLDNLESFVEFLIAFSTYRDYLTLGEAGRSLRPAKPCLEMVNQHPYFRVYKLKFATVPAQFGGWDCARATQGRQTASACRTDAG